MQAKDVMTTNVATVKPETSVSEVASTLLERRISGVPVVSGDGKIVGIVSEGDLMRRAETGTERPRGSWWLSGFTASDTVAARYIKAHGLRASDVMTKDVVTIVEDTPLATIAGLLEERHIKRVPVVRDEKLIGIVSRADLVRGLAVRPEVSKAGGSRDDRSMRDQLIQTIERENLAAPYHVNVIVEQGIVHLWGLVESETERNALRVAAENVAGVKEVMDHLGYLPVTLRFE